MSFVHLHVHSEYSFMDGACRLSNLVNRTKELGMSAVALTDHGGMHGALEFYVLARRAGLKPIIGCEVYVAAGSRLDKSKENHHLTLLATNREGYRNLVQLVSKAHLEGFYYRPRVDKALLNKHAAGLIALSGCLSGEIPRLLLAGQDRQARQVANQYRDIFGPANFYLELQDHGLSAEVWCNRMLVELGRSAGIPVVATNDVHFLEPSEAGVREMMGRLKAPGATSGPGAGRRPGLHLKSPAEMNTLFALIPEAVANTEKISGRCNLELELDTVRLPVFPAVFFNNRRDNRVQDGVQSEAQDEEQYKAPDGSKDESQKGLQEGLSEQPELSRDNMLRDLCYHSLPDKYPSPNCEVLERLERELATISHMKLSSYFLIVADIVQFARSQAIPVGPGRGSAGGSLVAYLVGITGIDPIRYGLFFERFLNPERPDLPDIDLDVCQRRRDEVLGYVREKYGEENVAQIGIFSTLGARGAVRDAGKALGIEPDVIDLIARQMPRFSGPGGLEHALATLPEFTRIPVEEEPFRNLLAGAKKIEGRVRHTSVHAAGIVICNGELGRLVPVERAPSGEIITQFGPQSIEALGLLKIDVLGLRNLTIINDTLDFLAKTRGIKLRMDEIPLDNPAAYRLLAQGDTLGCFQLESSGMRRLLQKLKPEKIEDLVCLLALYRPGPWDAGLVETFLRRRRGEEPPVFSHPRLEAILHETYGVILFQEQIMQIAHRVAGYNLGEADILRRALGKRSPSLAGEREKFVQGCLRQGIAEEPAQKIFDLLTQFAGYSFNKAHSVAYAQISYYTAFLKANYPVEYWAALLSGHTGYYGLSVYVEEARRKGIAILPPDINKSGAFFTVEGGSIRAGFGLIKGMGYRSILNVLEIRQTGGQFQSFFDFCRRVERRMVNRGALESLIKVGAFDSYGLSRPRLLVNLDRILKSVRKSVRKRDGRGLGQLAFWDIGLWPEDSGFVYRPDIMDYSRQEKLRMERELLGISLREHPLTQYRSLLLARKIRPLAGLNSLGSGKEVAIAGIPVHCRRQPSKNNKYLLFILLEDESGQAEVVVFPNVYEKYLYEITPDGIIIQGKLMGEGEEAKVIAQSIQALPGPGVVELARKTLS